MRSARRSLGFVTTFVRLVPPAQLTLMQTCAYEIEVLTQC